MANVLLFSDRVKETSTTTGNSDFTLAGAVSQFSAFSSRYSVGDPFYYVIAGQTGTEWESGRGHLSGATTLVRDAIQASSNSDTVVTFSAGTKDVFVSVTADAMNDIWPIVHQFNFRTNGGL